MTSHSVNYFSVAGLLLLAIAVVHGQDWKLRGSNDNINGINTQRLGGSLSGSQGQLDADLARSRGLTSGSLNYERPLIPVGPGAMTGHVGVAGNNQGGRAHNFGLGYNDPKTSATWDRQIAGPLRSDSYRVERNFYTSPNGNGRIGGYLQHDRNNFGYRNNQAGVMGRFNF